MRRPWIFLVVCGSLVLGGILGTRLAGLRDYVGTEAYAAAEKKEYELGSKEKRFEGPILAVDEDVFQVVTPQGLLDFYYEAFQISDQSGDTLKLILPYPSTYVTGDTCSGAYKPIEGYVSTERLFSDFAVMYNREGKVVQRSPLHADGVIVYADGAKSKLLW